MFGDESGVQVTGDDIVRWINDGQLDVVMKNETLLEETLLTDILNGTQNYNLPANLLILRSLSFRVDTSTGFLPLKGMSKTEFDLFVFGWDSTTERSIPVVYTIFNEDIILFPIPDIDYINSLKIYYQRKPASVSVDGDTPDLPEIYHLAIVKYCLSKAYELDEDFEASQAQTAQLDRDLSILRNRENWKIQETYPVITVLPEDAW